MALITRLSRMMRADFNALLDRLEEPDILLAQALRDMQDAVVNDERNLAALERDRQMLRQRRESRSLGNHNDAELDVCLDADQDDLARALLRRRLEQQRFDALLGQRERDLDDRIDSLQQILERRRHRLQELSADAALFDDTKESNQDPFSNIAMHTADMPMPVRDADVEIALLAAKQRRSS
ncbi:MAG TPA: hypothetical protein DDY14_08975 [Chromatiaceae bacterium]|jgi:phage shock protein A|nr:MAG: hypothetical protein N838_13060 [Thiohalocapsa sp. PB-PSB1]QQO54536.1 MAG: hypothetical protein N838_15500 [Thiohalocapsa sp. PB-PSB1]HBG95438.1 hypothetical protein [Chromatiaceae bacterium]HCS89492.1 hypothetical protein [Chromatiaceae bacterium]